MFIEMKRFEKKQPWSFSTAEMKGESILNKIMKISSWKYCKICCRLYSVTKNHWFRHNDRKISTIFVAEYVALNENFAFAIWRVWPAPKNQAGFISRLWSALHILHALVVSHSFSSAFAYILHSKYLSQSVLIHPRAFWRAGGTRFELNSLKDEFMLNFGWICSLSDEDRKSGHP